MDTCVYKNFSKKAYKMLRNDNKYKIFVLNLTMMTTAILMPLGCAFAQSSGAAPINLGLGSAPQSVIAESTAPSARSGTVGALPSTSVRAGPLSGYAHNIYEKSGVSFNALYLGEAITNPGSGDVPNSHAIGSEFRPGFDVDLNKLLGWHGAQFHFAESIFFLLSNIGPAPAYPADAAGYFIANPPFSTKHRSYLTLLSLEQKLDNNRIDIEVGRINADHYLDLLNCTTLLTCGDPIEMLSGGGAPPQYGFWGGRARYDVTPKWWVQAVAVENDLTDTNTDGFTFNTQTATGAKFAVAVARHETYLQDAFPGNYEVDLVFNSNRVTIPGFPKSVHKGTFSFLSREQQVVWRADGGSRHDPAPENITLFGSVSTDPDKSQPYNLFLQAGGWYGGFWRSHPLDRIGLMVSYIDINRYEINFQREQRVAAHGPNVATPTSSYSFEVDGSVALTPNFIFQPFAQYDLNPDSFYNINSPLVPKSGWVLGGTLIVYFGRALGLSIPPSP
jgi:porin